MTEKEALALPKARKPMPKTLNALKWNEKLTTSSLHKVNERNYLAIDVWNENGHVGREIFAEDGTKAVVRNGEVSRKALTKGVGGTWRWLSAAHAERAEIFFTLPDRTPKDPQELCEVLEHIKKANGKIKVSGAGSAGGYTAEELIQPLPDNWEKILEQRISPYKVLLVATKRIRDSLTDQSVWVDECICTVCGEKYHTDRHWHEMNHYCLGCGAECKTVRVTKSKDFYCTRTDAMLVFGKVGNTVTASGYEIETCIDEEGKVYHTPTCGNIYAWGPYGNYAYMNYFCGMSGVREYYDQWYKQEKMLDNWCRGWEQIVIPPPESVTNGTPLENARLKEYANKRMTYVNVVRYVTICRETPALEILCEKGWQEILRAIEIGAIKIKKGETKPHRALGLTRPELEKAAKERWGMGMLECYCSAKESGWILNDEELQQRELIKEIVQVCKKEKVPYTPQKVWTYIKRTERRELKKMRHPPMGADTLKKTMRTWIDYISVVLSAQNSGIEEYHLQTEDDWMPYDLFARHDRIVTRINEIRERAYKQKQAELKKAEEEKKRKKAAAFTAMWEKIHWADWERDGIIIQAAKSTEELVEEGRQLHHCVGTYTDNVLAGRVIFFIRQASEPDKSWYTLNIDIKTGKLIQLHGYANADSKDPNYSNITAWANLWLETVWKKGKKAAERRKKKQSKAA